MSDTPFETDRTSGAPVTLARLRALLDAYGANAARWPSGERDSALALLAESSEARALQAAAARMDALLDTVAAPQPSADLVRRVLAGAPAARPVPRRIMPRPRLAAVAALLAAAAAVVIWLLPRREPISTAPVEQYAISYQGGYTTPTDVLLVPPGVDLSRTAPVMGCVEKGLGCSVADPASERQSRSQRVERVNV